MRQAQGASLLLMTGAIVALAAPAWVPPPPLPDLMVWISAETLRARYGVELQRIGVLAAGRLVELRIKVVDRTKASTLFALGPALRAEGGALLVAPAQWRRARPKDDGACSVLFPNVGGEIEPGSRVSLAIGGQRVEPVVAK